jgi:itaconate CoA-transferase
MTPLSGLTVVSIEQAVAAPFATRQLADLGARVIKIERPDGGDFARGYDTTVLGQSSYFVWLNRSKESLAIDLKRDEGRDVLGRLLARADVFVQNLAPGAAARLGADPADLQRRHPRLIVCSVSGYGTGGPYAAHKAYDLLVQAETGVLSITGSPSEPSRAGISVADIAAGMYAFGGILTALVSRAATGRGTTLDISLFDALAEWMGAPMYYAMYGGSPPPRTGGHHPTVAPYGPFVCRDGARVFLAVQNAREWRRFCAEVLEQPALADDPRFESNAGRVSHREALHAIVDAVSATLSADALAARLDGAGIAWARLTAVEDLPRHPELAGSDVWRDVGSPGGRVRALVPPLRIAGVDPVMGDIPALGQHTDAILEELEIDADTRERWRRGRITA